MTETKPISQSQRTPIIDILRGCALFSVAVMNYSAIHDWNNHSKNANSNSISETIKTISEIVIESKGWTLLALLFGYGFSVLLKNIKQNEQNHYTFFINRMLWLFVFGFVNTLFFGGDILNDYALMGLILLLFYNCSTKSLFILATLILLLTPALQSLLGRYHLLFTPKYRDAFYELYNADTTLDSIKANLYMRYKWMLRLGYSIVLHLVQLGYFILGMALQRSNFFEMIDKKPRRVLKKIMFYSLIFSIITFVSQMVIEKYEWSFNDYYNLFYPKALSSMIFLSSLICWIYFSGYFKSTFNLIKATGRMTLTNYILQNIISFFLFICIRPDWAWHWYFFTGVIIYILQMFFSNWWLNKYNYGLLEWLWRSLSYKKWFPLIKTK
ncbi:DUF418 domain-containing protein [Flavobacterium sp. LS1R49]|uniref:DUF418 domain-containing protein n=1 Tax=Flavobacterium shii TaxID=2987687 RepID=A0A9X2ZDP6_9FLAO|nr:DUF418 domain-containing protein [Flavobacterium shii]MCV9928700.1 DUF418 domain-containing protein [Flavobacterium shii]